MADAIPSTIDTQVVLETACGCRRVIEIPHPQGQQIIVPLRETTYNLRLGEYRFPAPRNRTFCWNRYEWGSPVYVEQLPAPDYLN